MDSRTAQEVHCDTGSHMSHYRCVGRREGSPPNEAKTKSESQPAAGVACRCRVRVVWWTLDAVDGLTVNVHGRGPAVVAKRVKSFAARICATAQYCVTVEGRPLRLTWPPQRGGGVVRPDAASETTTGPGQNRSDLI